MELLTSRGSRKRPRVGRLALFWTVSAGQSDPHTSQALFFRGRKPSVGATVCMASDGVRSSAPIPCSTVHLDGWEPSPIGPYPRARFGTRVGRYPSAPGRIRLRPTEVRGPSCTSTGSAGGRSCPGCTTAIRSGRTGHDDPGCPFVSPPRPRPWGDDSSRQTDHVTQVSDTCSSTVRRGGSLVPGWSFGLVQGVGQSLRVSTRHRIRSDPGRVDRIFSYPGP